MSEVKDKPVKVTEYKGQVKNVLSIEEKKAEKPVKKGSK